MSLTKLEIMALEPKTIEVEIEALCGDVLLRAMPALKMVEILKQARDGEESDNLDVTHAIEFLAACIMDPSTGELAFSVEELTALAATTLPMDAITTMFAAAYELHGLTIKATEELEKNLEETPGGSSGGSSPGSEDTRT